METLLNNLKDSFDSLNEADNQLNLINELDNYQVEQLNYFLDKIFLEFEKVERSIKEKGIIKMKDINLEVRNHMIDHFEHLEYEGVENADNIGKIVQQVKSMKRVDNKKKTDLDYSRDLVSGGYFLVSNEDMKNFLNDLGLKSNDPFNDYVNLLANEINDLITN